MLAPSPVTVRLRGRDVQFDAIRLADIAEFTNKVQNERRAALTGSLDKLGGTPQERARLLWSVNAGNVEDTITEELAQLHNMTWLIDRCFARANPDVEGAWKASDALTIEEATIVFAALSAASGLAGRPTTKGEGTTRTEDETGGP
jgi:hypothetical protein